MPHKVMVLISGGIDSPVAAYMLARAGFDLEAINLDNRPFTDDNQFLKAPRVIQRIEEITGKKIPFYVAPHGASQVQIARKADRHMECVLCRRTMWRAASLLAKEHGCSYIATGESLGQVASQTLPNIAAENEAPILPMLRPLIGYDKIDIEAVAKRIGTYEISTGPGVCCTIVPPYPVTNATLLRTEQEDAKVNTAALAERAYREARRYDLPADSAM